MSNITASGGSSELDTNTLTLIGIIISVVIQILLCGDRALSRISKSSCHKGADGSIEVEVESNDRK